ncbi:MAG: PAS domain-containing protein [Clostridiales bacterium]|nr:PAS domain-containing protein [Clostridiales bacterium]
MKILFLVLFALALAYLGIGNFVLSLDKKNTKNRIFFLLCMDLTSWAVGYAFLYIAPDLKTACFWRIFGVIGFSFFSCLWLDFAIIIRYAQKEVLRPLQRLLMYSPSLAFCLFYLLYKPEVAVYRIGNNWIEASPINAIEILFTIYYVTYISIGLILIYNWGKNSPTIKEKKQSRTILITAAIAFIFAAITDTILPMFGILVFPSAIISISIAMLGSWYSLVTYKFMILTPQYASEYIFKAANDPIFILKEDLSIQDANDKALQVTGFVLSELVGVNFSRLLKEDCSGSLLSLLQTDRIDIWEVTLTGKVGCETVCSLSGARFFDEFNDFLGILITMHDISERKKHELLLENYNLELEQRIVERTVELEKANNAKGDFLVNVSHELRTPLNVILSAIQMFSLYIADDAIYSKEKAIKHLDTMRQNCFRLSRLINNILDTTKIDSGNFRLNIRNHDLVAVARAVIDSMEIYIRQKGLELSFESEVGEIIIACDLNSIERSLLNLLTNAVKYTNAGGKVSIRIYSDKDNVSLSVMDNGIGIPENMHGAVFERFRRVDNSLTKENEGSGIGLSLTKSMIEIQGGKITLKSEPGKGSEFIISLPLTRLSEGENPKPDDIDTQMLEQMIRLELSDIAKYTRKPLP